jgi:hypothetical protein
MVLGSSGDRKKQIPPFSRIGNSELPHWDAARKSFRSWDEAGGGANRLPESPELPKLEIEDHAADGGSQAEHTLR